jgi:TolB-like protein/tetratricopeptide (TPR) repeat protein
VAVVAATLTATTTGKKPRRGLAFLGFAAIVVMIAAVLVMRGQRTTPAHGRTEIAVLPLQNLSAGGPHAYFAGGLHDELLTQLAKVAALKVISRTSVMGYLNTIKPLKLIAAELGVGSIVEGTVQVEGQRLRVTVRLIDAATDEHLWAERYDRTLDDAFAIQSDVAQQIVKAVGAALAAGERQAITAPPTKNPEAYRLYLQAEEYRRRPGLLKVNFESAQSLYERAVTLDPGFALAHARLSKVHYNMSAFEYDDSPERGERMRAEAELALRLAPGLPQAHVAWAQVLVLRQEYARALGEIRLALQSAPNDAELWAAYGYRQRRMGNWSAVDSAYQRASQLDPRNADIQADLGGGTFTLRRRYADAVRANERSLALAPDYLASVVSIGYTRLLWTGDLRALRSALAAAPADADLGGGSRVLQYRAFLLLLERQPDSLVALMRSPKSRTFSADPVVFRADLWTGWAHRMRGDQPAARSAFAATLAAPGEEKAGAPNYWAVHAVRGLALAGLGRKTDALAEARWLQQSAAYRDDHFFGPGAVEERAHILAEAGEADAALDELERLLSEPSWVSAPLLRLDPRWDAIRNHPRFKALLVKYADPEKSAR